MYRLIIICLLLSTASFAQTFTYAAINIPGAVATQARGINNNGEVVGFYYTTQCSEPEVQFPNCFVHGFKMVNGTVTKLMVPNSVSTAILGVNDLGDLVGFTVLSNDGGSHAFIWLHTNVIKLINAPNGGSNSDEHTVAFGINKAGIVVGGLWFYSTPQGSGGWIWQNGTFSNMNPGDKVSGTCCWSVNGISNNGFLSGTNFYHDFVTAWFKAGTDEDFYPGTSDNDGTGVNSNSDVIGYSGGGKGWFAKHIELNENNDATEVNPSFITVAFPNSQATYPLGLNDSRWIAGTYTDSSGVMHGFIARPNF
jgi:hypothetical protein